MYSYQKELEKYERKIKKKKYKAVHDKAEKYLEALRRTLEKADGIPDIFRKHMNCLLYTSISKHTFCKANADDEAVMTCACEIVDCLGKYDSCLLYTSSSTVYVDIENLAYGNNEDSNGDGSELDENAYRRMQGYYTGEGISGTITIPPKTHRPVSYTHLEEAAAWFHDKWKVPQEAYLECMDAYINNETEYGWYLCLDSRCV